MTIPRLTHLQFLVVSLLMKGAAPGRDIRTSLKREHVRQSGPAFYQMMAGLEDHGVVEGWYEQQIVDAQIIRERHYKVLAEGKKSWKECRDFYARVLGARGALAHGA
ncbi:MAG TPA: hypothetical protein VGI83_04310 [Gemmatimonadales bacterium]|jgi:hypothetical protein